jgi:hypothetical protein
VECGGQTSRLSTASVELIVIDQFSSIMITFPATLYAQRMYMYICSSENLGQASKRIPVGVCLARILIWLAAIW